MGPMTKDRRGWIEFHERYRPRPGDLLRICGVAFINGRYRWDIRPTPICYRTAQAPIWVTDVV